MPSGLISRINSMLPHSGASPRSLELTLLEVTRLDYDAKSYSVFFRTAMSVHGSASLTQWQILLSLPQYTNPIESADITYI